MVQGYGPSVPVRVSLNGQDMSEEEEVLFEYHAPIVLQAIEPTYGPAKGGSRVTLTLAAPDSQDASPFTFKPEQRGDIRCRFNRTIVPAVEVPSNGTVVVCLAPATIPAGGVVSVDVSVNGGSDFTSEGLGFTYTPDTLACTISPRFGPTSGGTLVTFTSPGITTVAGSKAACMFGGMVVPAVENGQGFVSCRSPAVPAPVTLPVEVTLNGQDFSSYGLRYHFEAPLSVSSVTPSNGPVQGGTAVAVRGGRFRNESSDLLRCRFGDQDTPAAFHSASLIGCQAPPLRSVDEVQTLSVYSLAHVPEVQTVTVTADDYVEESFTIRTFSNLTMQPEVQLIHTSVADQDEIQTVSAGE